jgi:hypothetical protein
MATAVAGVCSCNHPYTYRNSIENPVWNQLSWRRERNSAAIWLRGMDYIYIMTSEEFHSTLKQNEPPAGLDQMLRALWYDAKGDWEMSHGIIQDIDTKEAALIHAYLHRKEGDDWNADYWYRQAGTKRTNHSIEEEWDSLVARFIL